MRGSDLLDKLENLDLNLVAGAAAPPSGRVRQKDRWWLPALTAAAACIVAIALPLTLAYLINGTAPTIEYGGPGANSRNTSHQASAGESGPEGGSGEGNARREPNKGGGMDGPLLDGPYDLEPKVSVAGYGDEYVWTRYTLGEDYTSVFDELPAEDYFKYNVQGLGAVPGLWSGVSDDIEPLDAPEAREWTKEFSGLLSGGYEEPVIYADLSGGSRRISIQARLLTSWRDDSSDGRLTVDICERDPVDPAYLAQLTALTNETVAVFPKDDQGGRRTVFAIGGLDSDRCLYTWLPFTDIWCRIAGGGGIPPEDMAAILRWLFSGPELLELIHPLGAYNPEVYPYIPTPQTNDYAAPIGGTSAGLTGRAGQNQNGHTVLCLEVDYRYGYDGRPLERYSINRLDNYEGEDKSMGSLDALEYDAVIEEYALQRGAMDSARSADVYKRDQPMHYTFNFTWDDYYVTAVFSEELTADGLWSFLRQLSGAEQAKGTDGPLSIEVK